MRELRITDEELFAYAAGELAEAAADRVRRRVEADPALARTVAMYRLAARSVASDDSEPAPEALLRRAKEIFQSAHESRSTRAGTASWIERLGAVVASLVYDSRVQPALVRGSSGAVELTYEWQGADLDLRAERRRSNDGPLGARRWRLTGQLAAEPRCGGFEVIACRAGSATPVATARADADALFTVDLDAGTWALRLRLPDGEVVVPELELS